MRLTAFQKFRSQQPGSLQPGSLQPRLRRSLSVSLVLLALALVVGISYPTSVAYSQTGFKVIVHADNGTQSITKDELSDLFLKKTTKWDVSGFNERVEPVDLNSPPEVRNAFSEEVHDRSTNAIKKYWQRLIFTGRGTPPKEVESDLEAMNFVAGNRGAVAYVSPAANLPSSVKQIRVSG